MKNENEKYEPYSVFDKYKESEQKTLREIGEEYKLNDPIYKSWFELKPIDLAKVKPYPNFPSYKYYSNVTDKKQIVLHHTVSNPNDIKGDIRWWLKNKKRVSTHIIIPTNGIPYQLFSSKYWAHHLGIPSSFLKEHGFDDYKTRNVKLNKESISIELDNWGGLKQVGEDLYETVYGNKLNIPQSEIMYFPNGFRGFNYYQKYTVDQIKTVGELLLFWGKKYNIPLDYNEDMWDVSKNALGGKEGVWSHVSYRKPIDKQDCFPQTELKDMLKIIGKL